MSIALNSSHAVIGYQNLPVAGSTQYIDAVDLDGYTITAKANPEANDSAATQVKNLVKDAYGAYRACDLFAKTGKFASQIANVAGSSSVARALKDGAGVFGKVAGGFILPYWVQLTVESKEMIVEISEKGGSCGRIENLVKKILDWIVAACYSLLFFLPGADALSSVAKVADAGADAIDVKQQAEAWVRADQLQKKEHISQAVRADLGAVKKQRLLHLVKAVVAFTGGIFGVLGMMYSTFVIPAIILTGLGLIGSILSIWKIFHANNMEWDITIKRQVQQLAAAGA